MKDSSEKLYTFTEKTKYWVQNKYIQLALFNTIMVMLVLLRSADYFKPYLPLTINIIIFTGIVLSVFLLGARSRQIFMMSLVFWLFAMVLRMLGLSVWAERAGVYTYEALVVGVALLFFESMKRRQKPRK